MKQYVGIPFDQAPCWELCRKVYREEFGVSLPAIGEEAPRILSLEAPQEGCLVRVIRTPPLSEHWGVFTRGHVLHAQRPASVMVPIGRFLERHPRTEFVKVL